MIDISRPGFHHQAKVCLGGQKVILAEVGLFSLHFFLHLLWPLWCNNELEGSICCISMSELTDALLASARVALARSR